MKTPRLPAGTPGPEKAAALTRALAHDVPDSPQAVQRLLDHLQREIVRVACEFTKANDEGDRLSQQYEETISEAMENSPQAKHLADLSNAADAAYNRTKAELFELCNELLAYMREPGEDLTQVLQGMRAGPAQKKETGQ